MRLRAWVLTVTAVTAAVPCLSVVGAEAGTPEPRAVAPRARPGMDAPLVGPTRESVPPWPSRPSGDVTMSFTRPGWISKVLVKPGDAVKKGDLLIQMDDRAEQVQLAKLKAEAGDTTRVRAAQKKLALAKVTQAKTEEAQQGGAATALEVQEKRLDTEIAELSLELAKFQQEQAHREYDSAKAQLERMKLISPIDGVVEQVVIEEGESADANQNLIQIVKTDPLWVDVPVPDEVVRTLKLHPGMSARVELPYGPDEKPPAPVTGKVLYVRQVADAGSRSRIVRVEVPNAAGRPAGEHVLITFPDPSRLASAVAKADGSSKEADIINPKHPKE